MRAVFVVFLAVAGCDCRSRISTLEVALDAPMRVDFGRAAAGTTVVRTLPLRNKSRAAITVDDFTVTPEGSPFFVDVSSVPLPAGASVDVQLRWVARGPALGDEMAVLSISAEGFADLLLVDLVGEVVAQDEVDAGPPDAGPPDAGPPDAGPPDAGPPDAGPPDAGPPDAGQVDAGVDGGIDAGPCVTTRTLFVSPLALYGGSATGIAFDSSDNLYIAENFVGGTNTSRVLKVDPLGFRTTLVPTGTIVSASAVAVDATGNVFVGDGNGMGLSGSTPLNKVWKVTPTGTISTFVAAVNDPTGLAFDSAGNLYVASFNDNAVYQYTPAGTYVGKFAGPFNRSPYGLAFDAAGNLYVAGFGPLLMHDTKVYKVTPSGVISTFADPGIIDPHSVAFGPNGDLWVSYYDDLKLVRVTPAGGMRLYPGGWVADDATNAIAFDSRGNLYLETNGGRTTTSPAIVKISGVDCPSP